MKKQETGLGKYIYMEWLFPVKDYYCSIRKNEVSVNLLQNGVVDTYSIFAKIEEILGVTE